MSDSGLMLSQIEIEIRLDADIEEMRAADLERRRNRRLDEDCGFYSCEDDGGFDDGITAGDGEQSRRCVHLPESDYNAPCPQAGGQPAGTTASAPAHVRKSGRSRRKRNQQQAG